MRVYNPTGKENSTHRISPCLLQDKVQTFKSSRYKAYTSLGPISSSLPPLWTLHNNSVEQLEIPPNTSSCFSLCTFCSLGLEGLLSVLPFPPSLSEFLIIINPSVLREFCWHCNKFLPLTNSLSTVLLPYLIKISLFYTGLLVFLSSQLIRRSLWAKIVALLIPSVYHIIDVELECKTTLHKYKLVWV